MKHVKRIETNRILLRIYHDETEYLINDQIAKDIKDQLEKCLNEKNISDQKNLNDNKE